MIILDQFLKLQVSLRKYLKRAEEQVQRRQMDADEPQIQKVSQQTKMDQIHGSQLRQDKEKMWLRPDEHDALELVSFPLTRAFAFYLQQVLGLQGALNHKRHKLHVQYILTTWLVSIWIWWQCNIKACV